MEPVSTSYIPNKLVVACADEVLFVWVEATAVHIAYAGSKGGLALRAVDFPHFDRRVARGGRNVATRPRGVDVPDSTAMALQDGFTSAGVGVPQPHRVVAATADEFASFLADEPDALDVFTVTSHRVRDGVGHDESRIIVEEPRDDGCLFRVVPRKLDLIGDRLVEHSQKSMWRHVCVAVRG